MTASTSHPRDPQWGPWLVPLSERTRVFQSSTPVVVYLAEQPNGSTFRYRCYTTAQAINLHASDASATWLYGNELEVIRANIRRIKALIVSRFRWTDQLASVIAFAQSKGVKVAFDCDDLVFDVSCIPLIMRTLDATSGDRLVDEAAYDYWYSYVGRLQATAELSDICILSTQPLAAVAAQSLGKPSHVVRNMASREQLALSKSIRASRRVRRKDNFIFGYFSGSPSHNRDFALITEALAEVLSSSRHIRLLVVGFLDLPSWFESAFAHQIDRKPLVDSETLVRCIADVDISLAPLQTNEFTKCKSELKFFDAAFLGVPTLCSDTGTIPLCAKESGAALFSGDDQWLSSLRASANLTKNELADLTCAAYDVAENHFSVLNIDMTASFGWLFD